MYLLLIMIINRKHEMFWNVKQSLVAFKNKILTVNMKCFEIKYIN